MYNLEVSGNQKVLKLHIEACFCEIFSLFKTFVHPYYMYRYTNNSYKILQSIKPRIKLLLFFKTHLFNHAISYDLYFQHVIRI